MDKIIKYACLALLLFSIAGCEKAMIYEVQLKQGRVMPYTLEEQIYRLYTDLELKPPSFVTVQSTKLFIGFNPRGSNYDYSGERAMLDKVLNSEDYPLDIRLNFEADKIGMARKALQNRLDKNGSLKVSTNQEAKIYTNYSDNKFRCYGGLSIDSYRLPMLDYNPDQNDTDLMNNNFYNIGHGRTELDVRYTPLPITYSLNNGKEIPLPQEKLSWETTGEAPLIGGIRVAGFRKANSLEHTLYIEYFSMDVSEERAKNERRELNAACVKEINNLDKNILSFIFFRGKRIDKSNIIFDESRTYIRWPSKELRGTYSFF